MRNIRRVLYLCTTFPRISETFVEREVRFLRQSLPLEVHSLWRGGHAPGIPVRPHPLRRLFRLFFHIPRWTVRHPRRMCRLLEAVLRHPPRSFLDAQETGLGLGTGILLADEIRRDPPGWIHSVWATAPATAAWTVHILTGTPFSFGAHAYDLFQNGGDCLLREKIASAAWIRTSTTAGREELVRRGADPERVHLVRRGLETLPEMNTPRSAEGGPRVLSVGRLVEKKGFRDQILLFAEWKKMRFPFEADIIGDGPLRRELENLIASHGLTRQVRLRGALPRHEIDPWFQRADLFLFTGLVARTGDRDGLPNVVPEAMAHGVPVAARASPGVCEAVADGETGVLLHSKSPGTWATNLAELWRDRDRRTLLAANARSWVEREFRTADNSRNLAKLIGNSLNETHPPQPH